MCRTRRSLIKARIIKGLFALSATGVLLSTSLVHATPITFSFTGIANNTASPVTQTVSGVTLTLKNPLCVGGTAGIKFRTTVDGLNLEPVTGTLHGDCNTGATVSASQFDLSFDKNVQFISYESKAFDAGTYDLVVNGATVSTGNTVGTSTTASNSNAFASTPTLTANTVATLKMLPLATPSAGGDGGKLKSITVDYKADQTISFSPALTGTIGTTATLTATSTSSLAVTLASSTPTVCTLSGTTVSFGAVGTCTVTANQAGNTAYNVATQVSANIVVSSAPKTNQTISFNTLATKVFGDADFNVSATATSNLPVSFSATGSCSLTSSTVKMTGAGDCSVKASQAGDTTYNAATDVTQTFAISKANQTVTFAPALTGTAGQSTTLSATGGLSTSAIVFASSTPTVCTVTGNSVAFAAVGTCTVTANQAGNANYNAATQVSANIVVSNAPKTEQTITFSPVVLTVMVGQGGNLSATSTSGLAVTLASTTPTVCTVSGNATGYGVTFVGVGNCIVTANQVGNDKFNAAKEVSATIVVSAAAKNDQIITFSPLSPEGTVGQTVTLSADATSGLAVTLASTTPTVCTVSGNVVSLMGAGNCIVTANQAGSEMFNAANEMFNAAKEVSATIVVKANQTISFSSPAAQVDPNNNPSLTLTATASSNLAVVFASSTPTICTVSGNVVSFVRDSLGGYQHGTTCTITANQAGNEKFNAAKEVSANIKVVASGQFLMKDQTVTFLTDLTAVAGQTVVLSAKTSGRDSMTTFTSYPVEVCQTTGNNITYKAEGMCTVVVKNTDNVLYNPVEKNFEIKVMSKGVFSLLFADSQSNPIYQAIEGESLKIGLTFKANSIDANKNAKFYLKIASGNTALMLTPTGLVTATDPLQMLTSLALPADQTTLLLYSGALPAGKYSVYAAYQTDDGKKEESTSIFTVKAKQTVAFNNLPTTAKAGDKVDLTFTSGVSNNPIALTSANVDICSVQNKTVTFVAEGNCILEATQAGNEAVTNASARGVISVKSAGVFSLSVTSELGQALAQANDADALKIGLTFKAPADDVGKTATFYLTASTATTKLMFANGNWVVATNPLQIAASSVLPKNEITLPLYSGTLGAGNYTISAKYQIGDKVVEATSVLNIVTKTFADAFAGKTGQLYVGINAIVKRSVDILKGIPASEETKSAITGAYAGTYVKSKETGASDNAAQEAATIAAMSAVFAAEREAVAAGAAANTAKAEYAATQIAGAFVGMDAGAATSTGASAASIESTLTTLTAKAKALDAMNKAIPMIK